MAHKVENGQELVRRAASKQVMIAGGSFIVALTLVGLFLVQQGQATNGIATLALAAVACLLLVPKDYLPAIAIACFAVFPYWLFGSTPIIGSTGLGPVIISVWVARMLTARRTGSPSSALLRAAAGIAIMLAAAVLVSLVLTSREGDKTLTYGPIPWSVSFCVALLAPVLVPRTTRMLELLRKTWLLVGALFGVACILEQVTRAPLIYGTLYLGRSLNVEQRWSVYRSISSFGHPLYAALFLSVAAVIGISYWLQRGEKWSLVLGLVAFLGTVATVSRGALLAVGIGVAVAAVIATQGRQKSVGRALRTSLLIIGGFGAIALTLNSSLINDRASSEEASVSSDARSDLLSVALNLWSQRPIFGSGPGTSSLVASSFTRLVVENSWLQLLISLGVVGFGLMVAFLLVMSVAAWQRRDSVSVGAIACFVIGVAVFNGIDDVPSLHTIMMGVFLIGLGASHATQPSLQHHSAVKMATR